LAKQLKDDLIQHLKELATTANNVPRFEHFCKICLTNLVGTTSVERSFSQMKLIKPHLRNRLGEENLSNLMKVPIKSPENLQDEQFDQIIDAWNKKPRRIYV